jgi:hypothetical protein
LPWRRPLAEKSYLFQNKINVKVTNYNKCSHEPVGKVKPQPPFPLAAAARQGFLTFVPRNSVVQTMSLPLPFHSPSLTAAGYWTI